MGRQDKSYDPSLVVVLWKLVQCCVPDQVYLQSTSICSEWILHSPAVIESSSIDFGHVIYSDLYF
jgi:hypothetical protein